MIDPIGGAPSTSARGLLTQGNGVLGKDDFLKLLVTQLKSQDPLNPSAPEEFAAQLAQFSSLEQLINVNENLQAQIESNARVTEAIFSSSSMDLIGKDVLVPGNDLLLVEGDNPPITVGVGAGGGEATLRIFDDAGNPVVEVQLGAIEGGRQVVPIDEHVSDLDAGRYTYEVEVVTADGPVEVQSLFRMRVEGVRFGAEGPRVTDGVREYSLADIAEIIEGR